MSQLWDAITALPGEQEAIIWITIAAAVVTTAFPLLYLVLAPFWRSSFGRVTMARECVLALVVDETIATTLSRLDGHAFGYWPTIILEIVTWSLVAVAGLALVAWLVVNQRKRD